MDMRTLLVVAWIVAAIIAAIELWKIAWDRGYATGYRDGYDDATPKLNVRPPDRGAGDSGRFQAHPMTETERDDAMVRFAAHPFWNGAMGALEIYDVATGRIIQPGEPLEIDKHYDVRPARRYVPDDEL